MNYTKQVEKLFDDKNWDGVTDLLIFIFNEENDSITRGILLSGRLCSHLKMRKKKRISKETFFIGQQKIKRDILFFVNKIDNNESNFETLKMFYFKDYDFSFLNNFLEIELKKSSIFSFLTKRSEAHPKEHCIASYHILAKLLKEIIVLLEQQKNEDARMTKLRNKVNFIEKETNEYVKALHQIYIRYHDIILKEIKRISSLNMTLQFNKKFNIYKGNILKDIRNSDLSECRTSNFDEKAFLIKDEILNRKTIIMNTYHEGTLTENVFKIFNLEIQMRRIILIDYMNRMEL